MRTKKVKSIPLQVYLSEKESLELTKYCLDNDESKSDVVREALAAYFRQQAGEAEPTTDGNRLATVAAWSLKPSVKLLDEHPSSLGMDKKYGRPVLVTPIAPALINQSNNQKPGSFSHASKQSRR